MQCSDPESGGKLECSSSSLPWAEELGGEGGVGGVREVGEVGEVGEAGETGAASSPTLGPGQWEQPGKKSKTLRWRQ